MVDARRTKKQPTLGQLLKGLRARNGWTLKEMSERSGIPVSTLSKVENDRLTLTYDKLLQLSQRLRIRMSELFAEPDEAGEAPVTARRSIGQLEHAVRVTTPNYDYHYLCTELRRKRMIPVITKIRAKSIDEFGELVRHSGEEYVYVLAGEIEVHTEFYDPVLLDEGQSIYIDSNMGHAYLAAPGCDEAITIGVCSSAEEDLMSSLLGLHGSDQASSALPTPANEANAPAKALKRRSPEGSRRERA
ncbi:MAG: Transcriptional regulator [uncultured Sphingomonadaceae bacterium]|uniref:Transcriptional regulator n=1 Tax=uncultured Sphingomonadaceae bacterium TaxID=169976 RepID=A0A6J4SRR2_9SPHN|nr:MAG: Transcriptional regulator [uncultured Sphingomonadaceae bacterium]